MLTNLLNLVNHCRVVNIGDPLNSSEAHAIDRHFHAHFTNVIAVASMRLRVFHKLTTAINADMILLSASVAILADMTRLAFRAFHGTE